MLSQYVDQLIVAGISILFFFWICSKKDARVFRLCVRGMKTYQTFFFCLLLLIMTIITYERSFFAYFQSDDFVILVQDCLGPHLLSQIKQRFLHGNGIFYRPFTSGLFVLDYMIWKTNAGGFHTTNIALHYVNSLLVFFIAGRLTQNKVAGFLGGLLFVIHPVHGEPVAWISGRFDVLCLFFFLSAIAFYLMSQIEWSQHRRTLYVLSLLSFICALLSKEMAITLPLVLILIDIFYPSHPRIRITSNMWDRAKSWKRYLPYFVLLGMYSLWRTHALGGLGGYTNAKGSIHSQFSMAIFDYLIDKLNRLTIPIFSFKPYHALFFLFLLLLFAVFMKKPCQFGLTWIFITLLPVTNMVVEGGVHDFLAERYLYIPSVGVCFVFIPLIQIFSERIGFSWVKTVVAGILLFTISMYYLDSTRFEVSVWRTASDIVKNIPLEVKAKYPTISRTHFYFESLPDNLHGAYIYRLGLEIAMQLVYSEDLEKNKDQRVYSHQVQDWKEVREGILGKTAFCFRYADGHVKDVTEEVLFERNLRAHTLDKQEYLIKDDLIDFRKAISEKFLYRGWVETPEEWGRWGNAKESSVIFALPEKRASEMTVKIRPSPLDKKDQVVQFYVNETFLKEVTFENRAWKVITFPLPETAFNGNVELLRILPKYVVSPASQKDSPDTRPLSIGVAYIKIRPIAL